MDEPRLINRRLYLSGTCCVSSESNRGNDNVAKG